MDVRRKLMLITNEFPFSVGEKMLETEISYLSKTFDIILVSVCDKEIQTRPIPEELRLFRIDNQPSFGEKVGYCFGLMTKTGIREMMSAFKKGYKAVSSSKMFYYQAKKIISELKRFGLYENLEDYLVYVYHNNASALAIALAAKKNPKIKFVVKTADSDLYQTGYAGNRQPFKRTVDKYATRLFFTTNADRQYYIKNFTDGKGNSDKYVIAAPGYPEIPSAGVNMKKDRFTIITCSRVNANTRLDKLLKALMLIHDREIKWIHVGIGPLLQKLSLTAERNLSIIDNIDYNFVGLRSSEWTKNLYSAKSADLFVSVANGAGISYGIVEAMAAGVPAVITNAGGMTEFVGEGNIVISEDADEQEIANAIIKAMDMSPEKRREIGERNKKKWKEKYDDKKTCSDFVQMLSSVT